MSEDNRKFNFKALSVGLGIGQIHYRSELSRLKLQSHIKIQSQPPSKLKSPAVIIDKKNPTKLTPYIMWPLIIFVDIIFLTFLVSAFGWVSYLLVKYIATPNEWNQLDIVKSVTELPLKSKVISLASFIFAYVTVFVAITKGTIGSILVKRCLK